VRFRLHGREFGDHIVAIAFIRIANRHGQTPALPVCRFARGSPGKWYRCTGSVSGRAPLLAMAGAEALLRGRKPPSASSRPDTRKISRFGRMGRLRHVRGNILATQGLEGRLGSAGTHALAPLHWLPFSTARPPKGVALIDGLVFIAVMMEIFALIAALAGRYDISIDVAVCGAVLALASGLFVVYAASGPTHPPSGATHRPSDLVAGSVGSRSEMSFPGLTAQMR
jgi:hypothetical protein